MAARPGRPERTARVALRSAGVELAPPACPGIRLDSVRVNGVLAREEAPPLDAEPLEWLLLTRLPVAGFEAAATVVTWYACRWAIELYFHVLKTGCRIEELQLRTPERYLPCLALYMVVAWRVLFTVMLGRIGPELDCEVLFDPREWQAAYIVVKRCPPPATPPTLGEIIRLVARLGGYLGRRHDPPPGPKAVWIGLQRLRDLVWALEAHEQVNQQGAAASCV